MGRQSPTPKTLAQKKKLHSQLRNLDRRISRLKNSLTNYYCKFSGTYYSVVKSITKLDQKRKETRLKLKGYEISEN